MDDERQLNGSPAMRVPGTGSDAHRQPTAADGAPRLPHIAYDEDGYPYDDGEPLAQNDKQATQILYAAPALRTLFGERRPDAFVGCDMFVYPRRRSRGVAPDVFVAFGAGDGGGERNSYKLFEGEPVPAFVLEVLSGTTKDSDLGPKRGIYAAMGIAEYWMFDPVGGSIPRRVAGLCLVAGAYRPIAPLAGATRWRSEALNLELRAEGRNLRLRDPETGEDLASHREEHTRRVAEAAARRAAEARAAEEAAARRAAEARAAEEAAARRAAEAELARLRRLHGDARMTS